MTILGTVYLNGCNYQIGYDLLSQSTTGNYSIVRFYGVLNVTNNYISWSRGTAQVRNTTASLSTYYSNGSYTVVTEDATLYHDDWGGYSAYITGSLNTTFVSGSTGGTITLPTINRYPILNSGTDFTDETNPVYNITAYNTYPLRVKLEAGGNTQLIIRDLTTRGSIIYTLELTETERTTLRNLCRNSNTLDVVETVCAMDGNTELFVSVRYYKMTIVNGNPVFSNFEFEDVNETTLALTGDNSVNVNGYSNIKVTIPVLNKAEALKQATMSKYQFRVGSGTPLDINYSDSGDVYGIINNASNGTYNVYAIDSRNNSTLVTKLASSEINYQPIFIDKQNSSIIRNNNQVGESAILSLNGTIWNNNFGEVVNSITSVTYRLKKTDSNTWINGTTVITPTVTNNEFSFEGLIASDNQDTTWDLDGSYNVEITVNDELSSTTISLILNSAIPTISLDKNGVGIMCAYDSSLGGYLQVNGMSININDYSDSETIVGTFADGKPIYRIVVNTYTPSVINDWEEVLTDYNVETIVKYGGKYSIFTLPLNGGGRNMWFSVSNGDIYMAIDATADISKPIVLWFDYTKTTD